MAAVYSLVARLWKLLGDAGAWRLVGPIHGRLYRLTAGAIGHRTAGLTHLLLTTTGRRSGAPRTVALTYLAHGGEYVLVASNGGSDRHPGWWLNLRATPRAMIQVGARMLAVEARTAAAAEREQLWPLVKAANPFYGLYEAVCTREIPVVVLQPVGSGR